MPRGRRPVLTESQRAEFLAVVLRRRSLNRDLASAIAEIKRLRERVEWIRATRDRLPSNIEMAERAGVKPQYMSKLANHVYRNKNPLDQLRAMEQQQ